MIFRRQLLVAEEDDLVVEQGLADTSGLEVTERPREVDTIDLGTESAGDGLYSKNPKASVVAQIVDRVPRLGQSPRLVIKENRRPEHLHQEKHRTVLRGLFPNSLSHFSSSSFL